MITTKNGVVCNFHTYAPAILGTSFTNMRVVGVIDYQLALTLSNVIATHASVSPMLPNTTNKDPTTYTYIVFKDVNNQTVVLASEWIDGATYIEIISNSVTVVVTGTNQTDLVTIRDALTAMGYQNFTITAK